MIKDSEKEYLLNLKQEDITMELLKELFATTAKGKPKFDPTDQFNLAANEYYNKKAELTTVGRFITNKVLLEPELIKLTGYYNIVLDAGTIKDVDKDIINLFQNEKFDDITWIHDYFDRCNWFSYGITYFIVPSLSAKLYIIDDEVQKKKDELIAKNQEAIMNNDINVVNDIENELISMSKELNKDEPGMMIYDSGSRGSFKNNYKNSVLMRGGVVNFSNPSEFQVSMRSLSEGIPKEDIYIFANILTAGAYARARGTVKGGYMGKQLRSAFQHVMVDEDPESDCGTQLTLNIGLGKDFSKLLYYRYIKTGKDKYTLLTSENMSKYIGTNIKLRSPMFCKGDKLCSKCAGQLFYKLGMLNAGLLTDKVGSTIMNKSMKQFHDSSIKLKPLNYEDYIHEV